MTRTLSADKDLSPSFAVAEGLEAVRQRVLQRLRLHRGEEWRASDTDVPWYDEILNEPQGASLASQIISAEIQKVEGVTGIRNVVVRQDGRANRLFYTADVDTIHGPMSLTAEGG